MMDLTPQAISGLTDPDQIRVVLFINNQQVHAPIVDAVVLSAAGTYLPLSGGTLTGALSGTSATFSGAVSGAAGTFTGLLTTNGQVAFPATQNPSANANTLDDYEEGTWTPTLSGSITAGVGTYTVQTGRYTKIGRLVYIQFSISVSAHTGTGDTLITGLPFTSSGNHFAASPYLNTYTFTGPHLFAFTATSTQINLQQSTAAGSVTAVPIDVSNSIQMSLTYEV